MHTMLPDDHVIRWTIVGNIDFCWSIERTSTATALFRFTGANDVDPSLVLTAPTGEFFNWLAHLKFHPVYDQALDEWHCMIDGMAATMFLFAFG